MLALLLDDSRVMRTIMGNILRKCGFEVAEAGNGREGLERLRQVALPEVILVDWNMPEMNGLDFVRSVRADPRYQAIRVLMVTTETEKDQLPLALKAGADDYVLKPFTQEIVVEKLQMIGVAAH